MNMTVETTPFADLLVIKPRVFVDNRGSFFESWNRDDFLKNGLDVVFVQDNQSISNLNVIRGLHFQVSPMEQGKLLRVARGAVLDIAVDLRKSQPTFGKHFKLVLDDSDNTMVYIPPGFAHGFRTLKDNTIFLYKSTKPYSPQHERVIIWNDPELNIDWGTKEPVISKKDEEAPSFKQFCNNNNF